MIKHLRGLFAASMLATLALGSTACSDSKNDEPGKPQDNVTITFTPEKLDLTPQSGKATVNIIGNAAWSISSDASWCTVFPSGGIKDQAIDVTVTYTANKEK